MKITDLELEQYGIYQNESWKPAAGCLNIIMGENESGKTTLLRFIRDMMFGYERGKWQGKKEIWDFSVRMDLHIAFIVMEKTNGPLMIKVKNLMMNYLLSGGMD